MNIEILVGKAMLDLHIFIYTIQIHSNKTLFITRPSNTFTQLKR